VEIGGFRQLGEFAGRRLAGQKNGAGGTARRSRESRPESASRFRTAPFPPAIVRDPDANTTQRWRFILKQRFDEGSDGLFGCPEEFASRLTNPSLLKARQPRPRSLARTSETSSRFRHPLLSTPSQGSGQAECMYTNQFFHEDVAERLEEGAPVQRKHRTQAQLTCGGTPDLAHKRSTANAFPQLPAWVRSARASALAPQDRHA
jgi:hypothetical protein